MYIKQTVSLFLLREDGRCLAIARRDNENDFGLVGGKVDENETLSHAIIRETLEESGLVIADPIAVFTCAEDSRRIAGQRYMNTTFIASTIIGTPHRQHNEPRLAWVWPISLTFGSYGAYNTRLIKHLNTPMYYFYDEFSNKLKPSYDINGCGPALFQKEIEDL